MSFDVVKFCRDYRINYATRGQQITEGWVGIYICPFCGKSEYGLAVHSLSGVVLCWRCGKHSQVELIRALLSCSISNAITLKKQYKGSRGYEIEEVTHAEVCNWPQGCGKLSERAKKYLWRRGFDAEFLEHTWSLRSTDNFGDYKFRIIAPIMVNGKMVSYQGRDYTDKADLRYKACKKENEVIPHQSIVYGLDQVKGNSCVVVEGITDVWRLGLGAICCFGIAWTLAQANMIADNFKTVFILFDTEEQAQIQALKLALVLSGRGVKVELATLEEGDPADMEDHAADLLMTELGLGGYK